MNYQDLFTVRSSNHSIYYDTISEKNKPPDKNRGGTRDIVERRETLRNVIQKPRA